MAATGDSAQATTQLPHVLSAAIHDQSKLESRVEAARKDYEDVVQKLKEQAELKLKLAETARRQPAKAAGTKKKKKVQTEEDMVRSQHPPRSPVSLSALRCRCQFLPTPNSETGGEEQAVS